MKLTEADVAWCEKYAAPCLADDGNHSLRERLLSLCREWRKQRQWIADAWAAMEAHLRARPELMDCACDVISGGGKCTVCRIRDVLKKGAEL